MEENENEACETCGFYDAQEIKCGCTFNCECGQQQLAVVK